MKKLFVLLVVMAFVMPNDVVAQKKKEKKASAKATHENIGQKLNVEECEELAMDITATNPRAVGNATSSNAAMATNLALLDARANLAQSLEVMVKGMTSSFAEQYNVGGKEVIKNVSKIEQQGYFDTFLRNTRPIKKNTYVKDDGTFNVYVCIEMTPEWSTAIFNKLREDEIMSIDVDEDMYLERMKEAREEFMKRRANE